MTMNYVNLVGTQAEKERKTKKKLVMNIIRPHIYSTTLEMLTLCKSLSPQTQAE